MIGLRRWATPRRLLRVLAAAVVLATMVIGYGRISEGVSTRRAAAAQESERQVAADLRLCEQGINRAREDFRLLIGDLTADAGPAEDQEETDDRARFQEILAARYFPVDCQAFVATGAVVPKEGT